MLGLWTDVKTSALLHVPKERKRTEMYYVLVFGDGSHEIVTSWRSAKIKLTGRSRSWCRSFGTRDLANNFVENELSSSNTIPKDTREVHVDACITAGNVAAVFDDDSVLIRQIPKDISIQRAHLLSLVLALEAASDDDDVPLLVMSPCETVRRLLTTNDATFVANNDLLVQITDLLSRRKTKVFGAAPRDQSTQALGARYASRGITPGQS